METSKDSSMMDIRSIVCALLAAATTGGTVYSFGIYGEDLKQSLGFSQTQLGYISTSFFVAGIFSWIPGLVVDRSGPRFSLILGGLLGALSTSLFWSIGRQFIDIRRPLLIPCLASLGVMTFMACALVIGSTFKIVVSRCSKSSAALMVGIAKGYLGLGAGIYACIFQAIPHTSHLDFLPLCSVGFLACCAFPAYVLVPATMDEAGSFRVTKLDTWILYAAFVSLALVVTGNVVAQLLFRGLGTSVTLALSVMLLWILPILSILFVPRERSEHISVGEQTSLLQSLPSTLTPELSTGPELDLGQMLQQPSTYLLLLTVTVLVGQGTQMVNNMAQMVKSKDLGEASIAASVALFSVAQAGARVTTGVLSENFLDTRGTPRPYFLAIAATIAGFAHLLLGIDDTQMSFVSGIFLSGIAFGMIWPLMVLIVKDFFGVRFLGRNYLFYDGFSCSIGTVVLSQLLSSTLYELNTPPGSHACYGPMCFRLTHLIIAGLAWMCGGASLILVRMTRETYSILYESHHLSLSTV